VSSGPNTATRDRTSTTTAASPVLLVGPLPPPLNGMTVMTALARLALVREDIPCVHLDLSDHRTVGNVGRLDWSNVLLAFQHWAAMHRALAQERPRLVYLPIAQSTLGFLRDSLLFQAARWHRVPVVVHLHGASFGSFYKGANRAVRAVVRWSLRDVPAAIVLGPSTRGAFEGLIPPERVHVVPNGIPSPPPFLPRPDPLDRFDVLYVSNMIEGKGYRDLLGAIPEVVRMHPTLRVRLAGEWSSARERDAVSAEIQRLGLGDHVRFVSTATGIRKAQLFQGARVFVFPPTAVEGQPVVILEAMSFGLPVITTRLGGIPDIVGEGETGLFVPPRHPEAIAKAILRLLGDEALCSRIGEAGRRRFHRSHRLGAFQRGLAAVLRPLPSPVRGAA